MTSESAASMNADIIKNVIKAHKTETSALLPVLHDIQDALGYIPPDAVPAIAKELNISRADVHGVITYYPHFRQTPVGKHVVQVCRAEACQSVGAEALEGHIKKSLCCGFHETSADGEVTLEPVYCLGHCAVGPNIIIDDQVHAQMTPERFDQLLTAARSEK